MKKILGKPCPCCFRNVTKWSFNEAYRRKAANGRASAKKTKANGNRPGPQRHVDVGLIYKLGLENMRVTDIARIVECTRSTVYKYLNAPI